MPGQEEQDDDRLSRSLSNLSESWADLQTHVEALRAENRAMKASLSVLTAPGVPGFSEPACDEVPEVEFEDAPAKPVFNGAEKSSDGKELRLLAELRDSPGSAAEGLVKGKELQQMMGCSDPRFDPDTPVQFDDISCLSLAAARLGMLAEDSSVFTDREEANLSRLTTWITTNESSRYSTWEHPTLAEKVARSLIFKILVTTAIIANAAYIGLSADNQVKNSFRRIQKLEPVEVSRIPDIMFTVWFIIELCVRLAAEQKHFFTNEEKIWNLLDIVLILNSLSEQIAPQLFSDFSFLRILRVFRLVRVIRVVKAVKALKALRTMVFALLNSFVALMWAFVMVGLIIFLFSILFLNGVGAYYDELDIDDQLHIEQAMLARASFGSLYNTGITLFSAVTGGNDWMNYGDILRQLKRDEEDLSGEFYFCVFAFYVGFCVIGMLNVVTGIFVDSAVTTRTEDEVVDAFTDEMKRRCQEVKRIFHEADVDRIGSLTYAQFKEHLDHPRVKAYFSGLEIDPGEAAIIFTLMDTNNNGRVSAEEFIDGTMKLKGSAKSVDLLLLMFDNVRFAMKFNSLCSYIEDEFRALKHVVDPGSVGQSRLFKPAAEIAADTAGIRQKKGSALQRVLTQQVKDRGNRQAVN